MTKQSNRSKQNRDVIRPKKKKVSATRPGLLTEKIKPVEPELPKEPKAKVVFKRMFASVVFGRLYAVVAIVILAATSLIWSILGAQLHMHNSDQLADPLLFQDKSTLGGAHFPGAHTFLLKWPLFWIIRLCHYSAMAFVVTTVILTVVTVTTMVVILYRIERRPAVFGTLCILLASVLILVPTVPYSGALLPVNMAMLTTRNLEYVFYLTGLALVVRFPNIRRWQFWLGTIVLGALIASDKLFLALSVGAAVIGLVLFGLARQKLMFRLQAYWLLAALLATTIAYGLLAVINASHLAHINSATTSSPYAIALSSHNLLLGGVFAVLGILTNFGANPAYDVTELRDIPHAFLTRLASLHSIGYVVNFCLLAYGIWAIGSLVIRSVKNRDNPKNLLAQGSSRAQAFSLLLLFSSVVAIAVFVVTNHYYAVDSRYLTISVFALFATIAVVVRHQVWRRNYVVVIGVCTILGILTSIPIAIDSYANQLQALTDITGRNKQVAAVLAGRNVHELVGDYWRVLPIQRVTDNHLQIEALGNCTQPTDSLTTTTRRPNLAHDSFAYLLSLDKGLTDFPQCSLEQIASVYGRPDASVLVSGTFAQPKEELLFYDHGIHPVSHHANSGHQTLSALQPISPGKLPNATCSGPTLMNIVAHEDDDLLFTSPDLLTQIKSGTCVRTVYLTAGDAGGGQFYWLGRQQGSEAAYANMLGRDTGWVQRVIKLGNRQYATVTSPRGNSKISLVFLNLPDGNLSGAGFAGSHNESLARLESGKIPGISSVDNQSIYSDAQLQNALVTLMQTFKPTDIHTQATANYSSNYPDHSDHLTTGRYAERARSLYIASLTPDESTPSIEYYLGYPVHDLDPNIAEPDLSEKEAAFLAYSKYDGAVCHTAMECSSTSTYEAYLTRQYQQPVTP